MRLLILDQQTHRQLRCVCWSKCILAIRSANASPTARMFTSCWPHRMSVYINPPVVTRYPLLGRHSTVTRPLLDSYSAVTRQLLGPVFLRAMNTSCQTYEYVVSHIWRCRVKHMNENMSGHTYESVMAHVWTSHDDESVPISAVW